MQWLMIMITVVDSGHSRRIEGTRRQQRTEFERQMLLRRGQNWVLALTWSVSGH